MFYVRFCVVLCLFLQQKNGPDCTPVERDKIRTRVRVNIASQNTAFLPILFYESTEFDVSEANQMEDSILLITTKYVSLD